MNTSYEFAIEVSEKYPFHKNSLPKIEHNTWVKHQWPLVYFIENPGKKIAYVGESTNALARIKNHLSNPERRVLNEISIIGSNKFNKSATLDIESSLIQYIAAEGTYQLQNGNYGLTTHNYFQQDLYKNLFREIWKKLMEKKIVTKSLSEIENTELFKYSPYKALNADQYNSVLEILDGLTSKQSNCIFISGSAGTGKTILATYLLKLLVSDTTTNKSEELNGDEILEIGYIKTFQQKYPNAKIGLVVAMSSLRETLKKVFKGIPGLKPNMVISPSETLKGVGKFDLLLIDEAHRLRQFRNLSWMGTFRKNNQKLGFGDEGTELDWIMANSHNQIFFYDASQSVKPSDVEARAFVNLLSKEKPLKLELKSQMRVKGGEDYIQFIDELLQVERQGKPQFHDPNYDLQIFESFSDLYNLLTKKEEELGLCRMIAGYAWPWLSNPKNQPKPASDTTDIELDGLKFRWNSVSNDWINSPNAFSEVGCIHTTQGYDLNYAAIIFGREINYNPKTGEIEIDPNLYFDRNGKTGIQDPEMLKAYIINIYKTILYRGIRGCYIYACNTELRKYLQQNIRTYRKNLPFRVLKNEAVKPYVNCIPLVDITVAAGDFSDLQNHHSTTWIEPPVEITPRKEYFVCQVKGESMNEIIPNGSYCLFKVDEGGSREGKIVLVQLANNQDADQGSAYTIKEYHSQKEISDDGWKHVSIFLKPKSTNPDFETLILNENSLEDFRVVGIFDRVLM